MDNTNINDVFSDIVFERQQCVSYFLKNKKVTKLKVKITINLRNQEKFKSLDEMSNFFYFQKYIYTRSLCTK